MITKTQAQRRRTKDRIAIFVVGGLTIAALVVMGNLSSCMVYSETMSVSPNIPTAPSTTVAGLPACSTALRGRIYVVTDALVPVALATVAAGGAVPVAVVCNGTNWIVL